MNIREHLRDALIAVAIGIAIALALSSCASLPPPPPAYSPGNAYQQQQQQQALAAQQNAMELGQVSAVSGLATQLLSTVTMLKSAW